ncbi:zinc finger, CCHC-type containing protein [Tanacetum coccineum]|uniref:Zinc finger, CCHC-type containing protein n=1 Tax=Tanacetum coccineum TaxID=301880 RepID=A0ABQ5H6W8_9ASTR
MEQYSDVEEMPFEEAIGRLKAYEGRLRLRQGGSTGENSLLLTKAEGQTMSKQNSKAPGGRGRGWNGGREWEYSNQNPCDKSHIKCFECQEYGHYASECMNIKKPEQEVHLTREMEEQTLLLCVKREDIPSMVMLNEDKVFPRLHESRNSSNRDMWCLDNGASNYMAGERNMFAELNESVTGRVWFGDGSAVEIKGKGRSYLGIQQFREDVIVDVLDNNKRQSLFGVYKFPIQKADDRPMVAEQFKLPPGVQKQMGNNNASGSGTLPSNTITNPRCEARAITTRSGLSYTPVPPIPPPLFDENESLIEKETEVTKDKVLLSTKDIQLPVNQKSHDPVKPVSSPISPEPSSAHVNNSPPSKEHAKETHLPYPQRIKAQKQKEKNDMQLHKFLEMFQKLHFNISLAEALVLMPKYTQMMKALFSNKEKLLEVANTPLTENRYPQKLANGSLSHSNRHIQGCTSKKVGYFSFPADFVVVDYEVNYRVPLILGRPFLRTARVLIDVYGEELVIRDGAISHIFPNNNFEDSFKMGDEDLNFIPNKELDKEDLIPIPRESKIGKECDFPLVNDFPKFSRLGTNPLFEKKDDFPSRNDESILKEEYSRQISSPKVNSETLQYDVLPISSSPSLSSSEASEYSKDEFDNDDDLFDMDSNNDEWKRILYGEDFERMNSDSDKTKDFDKSSLSVFQSLSNEFEPGGSSYVEGNDLVCYEDFHVSDVLFSTINEDKVFNPGILVDKNSKVHELNVLPTLPTRSSEIMLDFDLENFQVGPKNDILNPKVFRILEDSWFKIVEEQSNAHNFH